MYIADLHIHSRFSLATSRKITLPHLAGWAMCKGIHVLGTGDFTHPGWQAELAEHLEPDEDSGLYRLKGQPERPVTEREIADARPPLFCLQTEISSIYRRGGKSRRVHNLVFFPELDQVRRFSEKLARIGNIASDGRPILGLDSRDLLELVLETSERGVLIPAHIWTPWFSLFGSRSGFDAIEECFGDLTPHIFALETGLSSDPAMNRLVSALDGYALVSNSDAHSGANLGREANLFEGSPGYDGLFGALRDAAARKPLDGKGFAGTLEIYPEEGKYHLDGHRACQVVMTPEEAQAVNNVCPVCGKPLTIGVLHRVWELADRKTREPLLNERAVHPVLPLPAVLAQIHGLPVRGRKTEALYRECLERLGSEFAILSRLPVEDIAAWDPLLAEAVRRVRAGEIRLQGGYDGEFGTISIFTGEELREFRHSGHFRTGGNPPRPASEEDGKTPGAAGDRTHAPSEAFVPRRRASGQDGAEKEKPDEEAGFLLTEEQEKACAHRGGPLLVLAGPGSGKTRLLTERAARLLEEGTDPADLIALTFSRRAAEELSDRLKKRLRTGLLPFCGTFHALAWQKLVSARPEAALLSEMQAGILLEQAVSLEMPLLEKKDRRRVAERLARMREDCVPPAEGSPEAAALARYRALKRQGGLRVDFTDLLEWLVRRCGKDGPVRPKHLLVDEVQDLSRLQIRLLEAMLPAGGEGFFGIGDPDQAIYAFRGAVRDIETRLKELWPRLEERSLTASFRSGQKILDAASLAIRHGKGGLRAARKLETRLTAFAAESQGEEERWVAERTAELLGASSHTLLDQRKAEDRSPLAGSCAPSEVAVLVRLKAQIPSLLRALASRGVPAQAPSLALFWQDAELAEVLSCLERRFLADRLPGGLGSLLTENMSTAPPESFIPLFRKEGIFREGLTESGPWKELCRAFARCGCWENFFEEMRWLKETDLLRARAESVRLLTMHAAKGLEFRAVFLPGFCEGILPLDRGLLAGRESDLVPEALEEERRLFYVALTRASEAVFLSRSRTRTLYGRELELPASRFFADISDLFARRRLVRRADLRRVPGSLV